MASLERVYVPEAFRSALPNAESEGAWLRIEVDVRGRPNAETLSRELATTVVHYMLHTTSETFEIACFDRGQRVRAIAFGDRRWLERFGAPLAFEHPSLAKWLARGFLHASTDADDVVACFLGRDAPPAVVRRATDRVTFTAFVPARIASELETLAAAHATDAGTIAWCAWEAAKPRSYKKWKKAPGPAPSPPPSLALVEDARARPWSNASTAKTRIELEVPLRVVREIESIAERLDLGVGTVFSAAYELGRERFGDSGTST